MLHTTTNQPQMSRIAYFSTDELKVEGSLLKMFLGFAYELSSVAWLQFHSSVEQKLYLHFRREENISLCNIWCIRMYTILICLAFPGKQLGWLILSAHNYRPG